MSLTTIELWGTMLAMAAGTLLARASFLVGMGRREPGAKTQRALRPVAAAVLSALVAPAIVGPAIDAATLASPRLIAGLVAAVVAWRTRNAFFTIGLGMLVLWGLQRVWS